MSSCQQSRIACKSTGWILSTICTWIRAAVFCHAGTVQSSARKNSAFIQALRRALPLRRRAANTARPPRVAFLARKPCVRARLILLGWYVLFMVRMLFATHCATGFNNEPTIIASPIALVNRCLENRCNKTQHNRLDGRTGSYFYEISLPIVEHGYVIRVKFTPPQSY